MTTRFDPHTFPTASDNHRPTPNGADLPAHPDYWMLMSEALDGVLTPADQARLEDHLARCEACRARWQVWQALDARLHAMPMAEPPAQLATQVAARLHHLERHRRARLLVGLGGLAALVWLVGLIGLAGLLGTVMVLRWDQFMHTLQTLVTLWTGLVLVGRAIWGVVSDWLAQPGFIAFLALYLLMALVILWGWGRFLQRTTSDIHEL